MQINDKIRLTRLSKGYSQEFVAISLGIDTATYGRLERCQIKITVDRLFKICEILNIPMEKLISDLSDNNTLELILSEIKKLREINEKLLEIIKNKMS